MLWLVIFVLVLLFWLWRRAARRSAGSAAQGPRSSRGADVTARSGTSAPPVTTQARVTGARARERQPSPEHTTQGGLFSYGRSQTRRGREHSGPYAVIDVETTGLSPQGGDRVIEVAVARVSADGRIEDEFSTLINPEGRDTGPVFVHGISNDAVANAPTFAEVAPELLARFDGAVVVAHNASFEERFLAAELSRAGHTGLLLPALCSLWLARQTFDTPNHKLATLARHSGVPLVDAHTALGDVRVVCALLPRMLDTYRTPLLYGCDSFTLEGRGFTSGALRPVTRATALRKGTDGWMNTLMSRLPMTAADVEDDTAEAYLDTLAEVLADGKILGDEARQLAGLAGAAGMGAAQVASLNERFLETMRDAALDDAVLTAAELRELNRAAKALGVPDYFDGLIPTPTTTAVALSGADRSPYPPPGSGKVRRCGHCRAPGHNRLTCPDLTA